MHGMPEPSIYCTDWCFCLAHCWPLNRFYRYAFGEIFQIFDLAREIRYSFVDCCRTWSWIWRFQVCDFFWTLFVFVLFSESESIGLFILKLHMVFVCTSEFLCEHVFYLVSCSQNKIYANISDAVMVNAIVLSRLARCVLLVHEQVVRMTACFWTHFTWYLSIFMRFTWFSCTFMSFRQLAFELTKNISRNA